MNKLIIARPEISVTPSDIGRNVSVKLHTLANTALIGNIATSEQGLMQSTTLLRLSNNSNNNNQ